MMMTTTTTTTMRVRKTTRAAVLPPNATLPTLRQRSDSTCVCTRVGRTLCSELDSQMRQHYKQKREAENNFVHIFLLDLSIENNIEENEMLLE